MLHIQTQHIASYTGKPESITVMEEKKRKVWSCCAHRCGVTEAGQSPALSQELHSGAGVRLGSTWAQMKLKWIGWVWASEIHEEGKKKRRTTLIVKSTSCVTKINYLMLHASEFSQAVLLWKTYTSPPEKISVETMGNFCIIFVRSMYESVLCCAWL